MGIERVQCMWGGVMHLVGFVDEGGGGGAVSDVPAGGGGFGCPAGRLGSVRSVLWVRYVLK